ncbi:7TM diverse intracellular signaling domain-containing protein [Spirosoma flavus]
MARNLMVLFVLVVLAISGFAWYHNKSIQPLKTLPLRLAHWEDTTNQASIRQIIRSRNFESAREGRQNFGYTESIHWFRFQLKPDSLPDELTLEIRNHVINYVELFVIQQGKIVSLTKTGDWLPFSIRPIPTKTFAFPIDARANPTADYYLRLDNRYENLATEILLWRTSDFEDKEQREYFLWGIFSGVVVLVVLLNLIFWNVTSDKVYLWYALYVAGLSLRQFADSGLGFQYLWPGIPAINAPNPVIEAIWLYIPAVIQFQHYFLNLRRMNRPLFRIGQVLKYLLWTGWLVLIFMQIGDFPRRYPQMDVIITSIHAVVANCIMFVFVWVSVVAIRSKDDLKRAYGAAFAFQTLAQSFNVIQNTMRFQTGSTYLIDPYLILTVVFFIDLVVFAYLLAYRFRQSLSQNQQLRIDLTQSQQETNQQIIDVLDAERQHIHQLLRSDVGLRLQQARQLLANVVPSPLLTDSVRLVEQVDNELEQIVQNKLPVSVVEKGLITSFDELTEQLNQTQPVRFIFQQKGPVPKLTVEQEVQLYRIGNELINNIIKHADATTTQVELATNSDDVLLIVRDDGKGFDTSAVGKTASGIGVRNLYDRVHKLQGDIHMESGRNGTTITVSIPQKIQTS